MRGKERRKRDKREGRGEVRGESRGKKKRGGLSCYRDCFNKSQLSRGRRAPGFHNVHGAEKTRQQCCCLVC